MQLVALSGTHKTTWRHLEQHPHDGLRHSVKHMLVDERPQVEQQHDVRAQSGQRMVLIGMIAHWMDQQSAVDVALGLVRLLESDFRC